MTFCDEYFPPIKFCNGIVKKMLRGKIALNELTGFLQDFLSHKIAELIKEYLREKFFSEACLWKLIAANNLNDLQICYIRKRTIFGAANIVAFIQPVGTYLPDSLNYDSSDAVVSSSAFP